MNNRFSKIFYVLIILMLTFGFNIKRVDALASSIANAIWGVFSTFMSDRAGELNDELKKLRGDDEYPIDLEEIEERLNAELIDVYQRTNLINKIAGRDSDLSSISDNFLDNINLENERNKLETLDRLMDEVMRRLEQTGFFNYLDDNYGYTADEFRKILMNIYLRDIISPVVDPISNTFAGTEDDLSYEISPKYPRPGDNISISVMSFGINLDASNIEWRYKNSSLLRGRGEKVLQNFQLDKSGKRETFTVIVRKNDGGIIEQIINVRPANVDIIYESNTYIPPFYEGKPEYSHNSMIKFIAIPSVLDDSGRQMSTNEFTYRWYVNNQIVQETKRVGKNYFYFQDNFSNRVIQVSVNVRGLENDFNTLSGVSITPRDPEIVLYEDNPKYGAIFNRAFTNSVETSEREIAIRAVPYFFSSESGLSFSWFLNNRILADFTNQVVTFRADSSDTLLSNLSVRINHPSKLAQSAYNYFSLLVNN